MPGTGLSSTSSLCPGQYRTQGTGGGVQVSLFLKNYFREPESMESTTPLPQSLEGSKMPVQKFMAHGLPSRERGGPLHPREGQPPGYRRPCSSEGSGKEPQPVF